MIDQKVWIACEKVIIGFHQLKEKLLLLGINIIVMIRKKILQEFSWLYDFYSLLCKKTNAIKDCWMTRKNNSCNAFYGNDCFYGLRKN